MADLFLLKTIETMVSKELKVRSTYSNWLEFTCGIYQGSILGPLLLNISINDIFFEI